VSAVQIRPCPFGIEMKNYLENFQEIPLLSTDFKPFSSVKKPINRLNMRILKIFEKFLKKVLAKPGKQDIIIDGLEEGLIFLIVLVLLRQFRFFISL
jgi:hypothetical protein